MIISNLVIDRDGSIRIFLMDGSIRIFFNNLVLMISEYVYISIKILLISITIL